MRILAVLLLTVPTLANELRDAVEAGNAVAIAEATAPATFSASELVATCRAAADLALRLDVGPGERAAWDKAAARLAEFASRGKGLYGLWAQREIDVMKWRLKQAHDPDDGMKMAESLQELTRQFQETRAASEVHVRAASHLRAHALFPNANWYSCAGAIVYLHRKMELLKLKQSSIEIVQAMIEWLEAEAFVRADPPKKTEALAKVSAGIERLAPLLKEKEPAPEAIRLFNDLVLLGRGHLALERNCRLTMIRDTPRGITYGFAPSSAWQRVGDVIWQIAPSGGALRSIHVRKAEAKDPTKLARALFKADKKSVKSKRKTTGPKKGPVNDKIKDAVFYEMSGLDAAKRYRRFRTYILGKKGSPIFVVRIVEYRDPGKWDPGKGEPEKGEDPGVALLLRYLALR
ncbi:MAG: hypothetical protein ACYTGZ_22750 [Planctomycetota bacterium]|jgi:hypothetical protein